MMNGGMIWESRVFCLFTRDVHPVMVKKWWVGSGYDDFLCGVGSKKPLILPSKIFILINHYLFDLL